MSTRAQRPKGDISSTSFENMSLHSAYLAFAIRAAKVRTRGGRNHSIPVQRHIVEAIRYSFDFIDASAEYAFQLMTGKLGPDSRTITWLWRYIERQWTGLSLSDKLGFVGFMHGEDGFWKAESERALFEDLKHVRNALTHPGLFGKTTEAEFSDLDWEKPIWSKTTAHGKMARQGVARFAEHPHDLGINDARKAVEIALRHAVRLEDIFNANVVLFGPDSPHTGMRRHPRGVLNRMKNRHFDTTWVIARAAVRARV